MPRPPTSWSMWRTATCPPGRRMDPRAYWQAADDHERANGRLYSEIQFALPRDLDATGRQALAGAFAERVCGGERLPYTLALHKGEAETPDKPDNPHAHLMFSERGNDGIARSEEQWFKRHNPTAPERGGARKSRAAKAGDWLDTTRQAWEQTANRALEQAGLEARIDHRSLADRRDAAARDGDLDRAAELSREPHIHLGPSRHRASDGAAAREKRRQARRVERANAAHAAERDTARRQVARMEREIAAVGARLQETYDRVRRAVDARVQQAGRAIRQEQKELSAQVESLGKQVRQWAEQYAREQTRLGDQVASLGAHVRRLADQSAQERKAHTEWASTLVEQQQQMGAHVTTLTTEYEGLLKNVNRMIDASNNVTSELETLIR